MRCASQLYLILMWANLAMTVLFTLEAAIKIVAMGFWEYISLLWNKLDFFIVAVSLISLGVQSSGLKGLKAIRVLRALRPLRLIARLQGLKAAFLTIGLVLPALGNVMLLMLIVWVFFGILGVHAFAGRFWHCSDPSMGKHECVGLYRAHDGTLQPRVWQNVDWHFDHLGVSCLTLFTVATLDQWTDVMYSGMDAPSKVEQLLPI